VGASRIVPNYISLFPRSGEVAPFAGATRNLCDRKEVTLQDQMSALAKFWVFSSTHVAAHFTGVITDDYTSEFDPFSPQFGEKFSPANLPISIKDWTGTEISACIQTNGYLRRLDLLDMGSQPAQSDRICAHDDGHMHERSGPDSRSEWQDDPRSPVQPAIQPVLLRDPVHAGANPVHGHSSSAHVCLRGAGYNNVDCAYPMPRQRSAKWMVIKSDLG